MHFNIHKLKLAYDFRVILSFEAVKKVVDKVLGCSNESNAIEMADTNCRLFKILKKYKVINSLPSVNRFMKNVLRKK